MASGRVPKTVMTLREHLIMTHWGPGLLRVPPRSQTRLSYHFPTRPRKEAPPTRCISLARDLLPGTLRGRAWLSCQGAVGAICRKGVPLIAIIITTSRQAKLSHAPKRSDKPCGTSRTRW